MARTVTLRPWQKAALDRLAASDSPDFLAVATPGAGKTTFALMAAREAVAADPVRRLLVVVPTAHLKVQWSRAALAFDLHLDPQWSAADGALPGDMHGVVMRRPTIPRRRSTSPGSQWGRIRGSWPSAWCRKGSTSPGCGPGPSPSLSSAATRCATRTGRSCPAPNRWGSGSSRSRARSSPRSRPCRWASATAPNGWSTTADWPSRPTTRRWSWRSRRSRPVRRRLAALAPDGRTLREHKQHLRDANTSRVRLISRATGMTHAAVNGELNRTVGLKRISEATVEQLERRLEKADQWWNEASAKTLTA